MSSIKGTKKMVSADGIKKVKSSVKGCSCKRTKCVKNFCDCYKNSKLCGELCKCIDCQNVQHNNISVSNESGPELNTKQIDDCVIVDEELPINYIIVSKEPFNSTLTSDIIESTIECLIECATECQQNGCDAVTSENMVLEEFGRCLDEIIKLKD